jgi:hypothetical protein
MDKFFIFKYTFYRSYKNYKKKGHPDLLKAVLIITIANSFYIFSFLNLADMWLGYPLSKPLNVNALLNFCLSIYTLHVLIFSLYKDKILKEFENEILEESESRLVKIVTYFVIGFLLNLFVFVFWLKNLHSNLNFF